MSSYKERFEFAKEMIITSGQYLLSLKADRTKVEVKQKNDFVTLADKENEAFIISQIKEKFPQDGIFGEESGKSEDSLTGRWVIDPIDGTVNFMHGFPDYTISIAFEDEKGVLTFGLVYCPEQKELFSAFKGEGATLNGQAIHVSQSTDFSRELGLCVYPHRRREALDLYQIRQRRILDKISDLRSVGSAALSLCYVASARCVLYYEMFLGWYDIAAGIIILEEAGGKVTMDREGDYPIHIAASSAIIHDTLLEAIDD